MKYFLGFVLAVIVLILLIGGFHLYRVAIKNKKDMARFDGPQISVNKDLGKVLVIYYSLSGHTKEIAEKIAGFTDADIFEIKTAEEIKANPLFYYKVKQQLKNGNYPQLAGQLPDVSQYDTIFVGAPVWWYTMATPGLSFLEKMDFMSKNVVPFSTQGSNYGKYFEDFSVKAKNAELLKGESFNNLPDKYNAAVDNKIAVWMNGL